METLKIALFIACYTYAAGKESSKELNALFRTCLFLIHGSVGSYAPKENMFLVSISLAESGSHTFPLIVMFGILRVARTDVQNGLVKNLIFEA